MIRVRRQAAAPPELVKAAARESEKLKEFLRLNAAGKGFKYKAYRITRVKELLEGAFHGKCAYCETRYGAGAVVNVEHFRPKGRVDRENMEPASGYDWLAAEWTNLLPSCYRCNSLNKDFIPARNRKETVGKANWFPLWDENARATKSGEEGREYPLLLNPCVDDSERYLAFDDNGGVNAAAGLSAKERAKAEASIRIYGLGRQVLVKERDDYAKRVLTQIRRVERNYQDWLSTGNERDLLEEWSELQKFVPENQPYCLASRQLIEARIKPAMRKAIEKLEKAASRRRPR